MSRKAKLRVEEKLVLVRSCLDGEQSVSEVSRKFHVDRKSISEWIRQYETEGVSGLDPGKRNRKYTPERKRTAVEAYLSGEGSLQEICKKHKIHSDFQLRE